MDIHDNEDLKNVFGKLAGYESQKTGVDWQTIEKKLPSGRPAGWRAAGLAALFISSLLILMTRNTGMTPVVVNQTPSMKAEEVAEKQAGTTINDSSIQGQDGIPKKYFVRKTDNVLQTTTSENETISKSPVSISSLEEFASASENQEGDSLISLSDEPSLDSLVNENDVAPKLEEEERKTAERGHKLIAYAEASYFFGTINPILTDHFSLEGYSSTPGLAVKLGVSYPVIKLFNRQIYLGVNYQAAHKAFTFNGVNFGESLQEVNLHGGGTAHFVGAELYVAGRHGFDFSSAYMIKINRDAATQYWGNSSVQLTLSKYFSKIKGVGQLGISVTKGIPLDTSPQYFTYAPTMIGVRVKR